LSQFVKISLHGTLSYSPLLLQYRFRLWVHSHLQEPPNTHINQKNTDRLIRHISFPPFPSFHPSKNPLTLMNSSSRMESQSYTKLSPYFTLIWLTFAALIFLFDFSTLTTASGLDLNAVRDYTQSLHLSSRLESNRMLLSIICPVSNLFYLILTLTKQIIQN